MAHVRAKIDSGFETFGHLIYRNRFKTLVLMLILMGGVLSQLPKLGFDSTNESYFHEDDPTLSDYDAFREQFGRQDTVVVALTPREVFDRDFLQKLTRFHDTLGAEVPYVKEVTSLINVRHTRGEGDVLIVEDLLEEIPQTADELAGLK